MMDIRKEMKERARLSRCLVNALAYEVEYIYTDMNANYDVICINESIKETKIALQKFIDNLTELEYLLYLLKKDASQ